MKDIELYIPEQLKSYKEDILKSLKPTLKMTGKVGTTELWGSKIGGDPYLLIGEELPKNKQGEALRLLAQINFEDVPHIDSMPTQGILQFFVDATDDLVGADFDNPTTQEGFRVIYRQDIIKDKSKLVTEFNYDIGEDEEEFISPLEAELVFEERLQPVTTCDYRFGSEFLVGFEGEKEVQDGDRTVELWELYVDHMSNIGHRIGGYPFFTQYDPRDEGSKYDTLLLQIDTDDDLGIMWGDSGVANFFINKDDLARLDFSDVLYNWDCF
ncbi:YwqG family protein [Bacillus sp. FJAT-51639]|uniref:YwqG family protein n=1 Tax=Bacillus bruguierae TaxID=3127667 RepID=A0ABU8FME7_9BACI